MTTTASDKRPRTPQQMAALPEGPAFGIEERIIKGKLVRVPVMQSVVLFWSEDDDPMGYFDEDGEYWHLGRYADGTWFRQRR